MGGRGAIQKMEAPQIAVSTNKIRDIGLLMC